MKKSAKHGAAGGVRGKSLTRRLLDWFEREKRDLPWRRTRDPYRLWIAEVMLQQTRVATVIPYYERFLARFPDIAQLAAASDSALMKAWEGLGYYARARHLREAARRVVREHGGRLPSSRDELRQLPGFGPYTAASLASQAFNEDVAAVDGNVMRVLARVFLVSSDLRSSKTKAELQRLADELLPRGRAGAFNEAMMELGAVVCVPKRPRCEACPIERFCGARQTGRVAELPFKSKAAPVPHHQIAIGVVRRAGRVLIALRPAEGLLGNLWEFPGGKLQPGETLEECCAREIFEETGLTVRVGEKFSEVRHDYTHFRITLHAFWCEYESGTARPRTSQKVRWVHPRRLDEYVFPKANKKIIEDLRASLRQQVARSDFRVR